MKKYTITRVVTVYEAEYKIRCWGNFIMEKVIAQSETVEFQNKISNVVSREKNKSLVKVSKTFRAMQIVKFNMQKVTYSAIKRTIDICAGLVGTVLLLPVMFVVKLAYIKNGDYASILFKQERIGKNGKPIQIYKIRSMVNNAEEILDKLMEENPEIREEYSKNKKLEHDPRITRVGAFIRKTSLDEFRTIYINIIWKNVTYRSSSISSKGKEGHGRIL